MAVPSSVARRPGTRLLVEYAADPGWARERVLMWPCAGATDVIQSCIYLAPDGTGDFSRQEAFTSVYPAWSAEVNVRQFAPYMERSDVEHHMNIARREVRRVLEGRQQAPQPTEFLYWEGHVFPLTRAGALRAGRDALVGHRPVVERGAGGSPLRRLRGKGPGVLAEAATPVLADQPVLPVGTTVAEPAVQPRGADAAARVETVPP